MDLDGKDKGNISLPARLQSNFDEDKLDIIIVNTQKAFYDLKIAETNKRIQRLEKQKRELEDTLRDINDSIQVLREEEIQEISSLKSQVTAQVIKVEECKKQLVILEETGLDEESAHIAKIMDINDKYDKMRLALTSQIKLLSNYPISTLDARINVLEDYKSKSFILEEKLDAQNQALIHDREQMSENLRRIEWKAKNDIKKFKEDLYNRLLDVAGAFQLEVACHMPYSISRLMLENTSLSNMLSMVAKTTVLKKQDVQYKVTAKKYKKEINDRQSSTKRSAVITKLERTMVATLHEICNKANANLPKLDNLDYLTAEQYMINIDNMKTKAQKCEERVKRLEILLFCEEKKLAAAEYRKQRISEHLQAHLQMLYDVKNVLMNLITIQKRENYG